MILDLECLTDVAITAQGATVGGHQSLSYIPGQCLLGAMAGIGYGDHGLPDGTWRLFHSGAMRFGCGYPVIEQARAWPIPLSLYAPKREEAWTADHRIAPAVVNLARPGRQKGTQYRQLRDGYVDRYGRVHAPTLRHSMRTAIGEGGKARDGFLFTLQSIPVGTRLRAEIQADDPALLAPLAGLLNRGAISVGRSRHAEYGRVRVSEAAVDADRPESVPFPADRPVKEVLLWCLSDLCLRDLETGQPTFNPSAAHVGLPDGWRFDPGRSFIRTRSYSPFNRARNRPGMERQVITAGSVLRFCARGETPALTGPQWEAARAAVAAAVGDYRAEGLGLVVFEPVLLSASSPIFDPLPPTQPLPRTEGPVAEAPEDELVRWAVRRAEERAALDALWSKVNGFLDELWKRPPSRRTIPASQWGELRRIALAHAGRGVEPLTQQLQSFMAPSRDRIVREKDARGQMIESKRAVTGGVRASSDRWRDAYKQVTLGDALVNFVKGCSDAEAAIALELVAVHAVRRAKREVAR